MSRRRRRLFQIYPPGLKCLLDYPSTWNTASSYTNLTATGTGTSGTNSITASGTITNLIQAGEKLRIGGTDIYTVATASLLAITTVEPLTTNYVAAAMALDRASQWTDSSGQGNNFTQSTAATKSVIKPATLNSHGVMAFDGVNTLTGPSGLYTIPNGPNTLFTIARRASEAATTTRLLTMVQSGVANRYLTSFSSTAGSVSFASSGGTSISNTGNTNTNFQIMCFRRTGTAQGVIINNGTEAVNASGGNGTPVDRCDLGSLSGAGGLIGDIAKVALWDSYLSDAECQYMFKTLSGETGIAIS